jgi:hypothetical protein
VTGRPSEGTPLPSVSAIPTKLASPDPEDPSGWTYCYVGSEYYPIEDPRWYLQFSDSIVGALSNESNCKQTVMAMSPIEVVQQAPFLLEINTAFVRGTQRTLSDVLQASENGELVSSTLSDPFQASTTRSKVTDPKPTRLPSTASTTRTRIDASKTDDSISSTHGQTEPTESPDGSDELDGHESIVESLTAASTTHSSPSDEEDSTMIQPQQTSQDHRPDTVASSSQHFDALASLINIAAQHGSDKTASITTENHSSTGTNGASVVRPQGQTIAGLTTVIANGEGDTPVSQSIATITYPDGTLTSIIPVDGMSSLPAQAIQAVDDMESFLTLGDATATLISSSLYVVGTQTLIPAGPAVTVSGTPISLASSATAVVVGSSTSRLASTRGIGDYVWAGIADMLSAVKDDTISASDAVEGTTDEGIGNVVATVSHIGTTLVSTANDGRLVTATISIEEKASSSQGNLLSILLDAASDEATNSAGEIVSPTSVKIVSTAADGQLVTATISAESSASSSPGTLPSMSTVIVRKSGATTQ